MPVKRFEPYHGLVLTRLVRSTQPVQLQMAVKKSDDSWSAYLINESVALFIKCSVSPSTLRREDAKTWPFTFSINQLVQMLDFEQQGKTIYVALVCSNRVPFDDETSICLLTPRDVERLIDFNTVGIESISIKDAHGRHSFEVSGNGTVVRIRKSAFNNWAIPSNRSSVAALQERGDARTPPPRGVGPTLTVRSTPPVGRRTLLPAAQVPNPYRTGSGYHTIFNLLSGDSPLTMEELIRASMRELGKSEHVVSISVGVVTSPTEEDGRGDCRGNMSAQGHLYYVNQDGNGKLRVFPRISPLAARIRGFRTSDIQSSAADERRETMVLQRNRQITNPYRPGSQYNLIFSLLAGPQRLTKDELITMVAASSGKTVETIAYSVWVVISPRHTAENGDPRGNRASKGHLYYVTKDAQGRLTVHPWIPPMEQRR